MIKTVSGCQRYARVQSLCGDIDGYGKEFMVKVKDLIPEVQ